MDISASVQSLSSSPVVDFSTLLRPIDLSDMVTNNDLSLAHEPTLLAAYAPFTAGPESMVLAQQFDQDILGDMGRLWNTFIESGQVWALLIGIVVGYLLRNLTAY